MRTMLRNVGVPVGFVLGLAFAGLAGASDASAEPKDCTESCKCQTACEDKLTTCNESCEKAGEDEKTKCLIGCNEKLMECMKGCPDPDCSCGGY